MPLQYVQKGMRDKKLEDIFSHSVFLHNVFLKHNASNVKSKKITFQANEKQNW